MNPERVIGVGAGVIAIALFAAMLSVALDYWSIIQSSTWEETSGHVTKRTDITSPSFICFVHDAHYFEIEYRYADQGGKTRVGVAQASIENGIFEGASIRIKFDPNNPEISLPEDSIGGYKAAKGLTALFALIASFGMLIVSLRLWKEAPRFDRFI